MVNPATEPALVYRASRSIRVKTSIKVTPKVFLLQSQRVIYQVWGKSSIMKIENWKEKERKSEKQ